MAVKTTILKGGSIIFNNWEINYQRGRPSRICGPVLIEWNDKNDSWKTYFKPEVEEWMKENINFNWILKTHFGDTVLYFEDETDAMFFKMRWC